MVEFYEDRLANNLKSLKNVDPMDFLGRFPFLLDKLVECHRNRDNFSFIKTLDSIEEIKQILDKKYTAQLMKQLIKDISSDKDMRIETIKQNMAEIELFKRYLKDKHLLKIENERIVQYPLPIIFELTRFFTEKGKEFDDILTILENERENDFNMYTSTIRQKMDLLYNQNLIFLNEPVISEDNSITSTVSNRFKKRNESMKE